MPNSEQIEAVDHRAKAEALLQPPDFHDRTAAKAERLAQAQVHATLAVEKRLGEVAEILSRPSAEEERRASAELADAMRGDL